MPLTSHPDETSASLLREADTLLSALLGNTLIGIFVAQDDRFVFVNQRLGELFGYSPRELCAGMGPLDLVATSDQLEVRQEVDRRMRGDAKGSLFTFQGACKDSSLFDVEVYGIATQLASRPAIIGVLLDVSSRCTAERAATEQLHFITQLLEAIPSPVFYKDEVGRYIGCNSAFERFLGLDRGNLIGRTAHDISPKELADVYVAADQALFEQPGTQTYEAAVAYADGTRRTAVFQKATFSKADGDLGGLVGVILDITERKKMEEIVWREANYDALTGLPNRRLFRDRLKNELKQAQRGERKLAVLFIDLDRFKEVNDTLGHDTGDQLLIEAAARIRATLRSSDFVSRQGGDEFVVALLADPGGVRAVAEKIILSLARPFGLDGQTVYVSASIGIAMFPNDSHESETLISYADQAMYAAKARGRNCFCHFDPSMQAFALARLEIGNDLRRAAIERQFELHYQPIIDLTSGRIVKVEALLRWNHPTRGRVSPAEFIPVCEDIGIIGDIGNWALQEAIAAASRWEMARRGSGAAESIQVSVNISPRQFVSGNCAKWLGYLRQHGLPPHLLAVEITEGLLLDERQAVVETLLGFRDAGIQVSIDDFGTGYSAMSYLKKFDIDYLKIDRSFVRDLTSDPIDLAIAEAIIVMAHKLGIQVIAEGVETEEQRDLLRQAGCDYAQGYLFAKPMPAADIERLINA